MRKQNCPARRQSVELSPLALLALAKMYEREKRGDWDLSGEALAKSIGLTDEQLVSVMDELEAKGRAIVQPDEEDTLPRN